MDDEEIPPSIKVKPLSIDLGRVWFVDIHLQSCNSDLTLICCSYKRETSKQVVIRNTGKVSYWK